jgi:transposase InsO family protein
VNFGLFSIILRRLGSIQQAIKRPPRQWTKPDNYSLALNAVLDITRSKQELVLENALLRQQLSVLQRQIRRPKLSWCDRARIELGSRRVVHFGITRHPTDRWIAQQLRNATPFREGPRFLIRDNDRKYGPSFDRVAAGIEVLKTPYRAPKANAICERFLGSLRRECLNHFVILGRVQKQVRTFGAKSPWTKEENSQVVFESLPREASISSGEGVHTVL